MAWADHTAPRLALDNRPLRSLGQQAVQDVPGLLR